MTRQYEPREWNQIVRAVGVSADMPFIWEKLEMAAAQMGENYRVARVSLPHGPGVRLFGLAIVQDVIDATVICA